MGTEHGIRSVAFDLDGLMFNTEELYVDVGAELLRRRDRRICRELLDRMMGRPSRVALQTMIDFHGLSDTVSQLAEETDAIMGEVLQTRLRPLPGLFALLAALEEWRIPKAIATSSRRVYLDRLLAPFGLADRFSFFLTAEDVAQGKPHPEIYLKAADRFGVSPAQMLVLEDSAAGCSAAVAAGALTIAVPGEHSRHHAFPGVSLVADSLADDRLYALLRNGAPNNGDR